MQASARICGRRRSRQRDPKCRLKSSQYILIIPHRVIQLTTISFWVPETRLCLPQANKQIPFKASEVPSNYVIYFYFFPIHRRVLCSQQIRDKVHRIFPEHAERSFLDPEHSFVAVRRILPTRFAKQKFVRLRTDLRPTICVIARIWR